MFNAVFIINDVVEFHPDTNTLRDMNTFSTINLQVTASKCLEILIANHGSVVRKEEVMDKVWTGRGVVPTNNNYYQLLVLLRKAFEQCDSIDGCEIIQTIPRSGVVIPGNVTIQKSISKEDVKAIDTPRLGRFFFYKKIKSHGFTSFACCALFPFFIFIIYIINLARADNVKWDWSSYHKAEETGTCKIYTNSFGHEPYDIKFERCLYLPYVYVTRIYGVKRDSVIMCDKNLKTNKPTKCASFYKVLK